MLWTTVNVWNQAYVDHIYNLSPIIVLVAFNPLIQFIKSEIKFGYDLNGTKYISTPFADDFDLTTTNSKTHK